MKVELDNIRLGHSVLTDRVFVGIVAKQAKAGAIIWNNKIDVTNDFIDAVIMNGK